MTIALLASSASLAKADVLTDVGTAITSQVTSYGTLAATVTVAIIAVGLGIKFGKRLFSKV